MIIAPVSLYRQQRALPGMESMKRPLAAGCYFTLRKINISTIALIIGLIIVNVIAAWCRNERRSARVTAFAGSRQSGRKTGHCRLRHGYVSGGKSMALCQQWHSTKV